MQPIANLHVTKTFDLDDIFVYKQTGMKLGNSPLNTRGKNQQVYLRGYKSAYTRVQHSYPSVIHIITYPLRSQYR